MTHVSRKKLPTETQDVFYKALLKVFKNNSTEDLHKIFTTLLTKTETIMIYKRLFILLLLDEGYNEREIAKATHTTRQTVARIRLQLLEIPDENRRYTLEKIKSWKNINLAKSTIKRILDAPISRSDIKKKISPFCIQ